MNKYKKGQLEERSIKSKVFIKYAKMKTFKKISLSQGLASIYINIKLFTSCCLDVLTKRFFVSSFYSNKITMHNTSGQIRAELAANNRLQVKQSVIVYQK